MPNRDPLLPLTEPQQRLLSVGVRQLSDLIDRIDALLEPTQTPTSGHILDNDVDAAAAAAARRLLQDARAGLGELRGLVGATPDHQSRRGMLGALASSAWTIAEDLHPRRLRGYGAVDPRAAEQISPVVDQLAAALLGVASALNRPAPAVSSNGPTVAEASQ